MPLMTTAQVRVQDPILTKIVLGYDKQEFVGSHLMPPVPVTLRGGKVIEFGKQNRIAYDTKRSPGAATNRRQLYYGSQSYSLTQDSIEGEVPIEHIEEATNAELPFDLQQIAVESAMESIMLNLEVEQATVQTTAANYASTNKVTLSGNDQWENQVSTPKADVLEWKEAIRSLTGKYPNSATIGPNVFRALKEHSSIKDQIKYTSSDSVTLEMLAKMFELERGIKVGLASTDDPITGASVDIWGDYFVLAYVPPIVSSRMMPSYGYTYQLVNYPIAEEAYYDRNHKTWYFPVTNETQPVITNASAGFLASAVSGL